MDGPQHGSRNHRGRGSVGLARLRQEFHRFREEVGCIRSLPSLHRGRPSFTRVDIDCETSFEDGTLPDSEELPHGIPTLATAGDEDDGIDRSVPIHEAQDLGLEISRSQECTNVQSSSLLLNESLAKCVSDEESERLVVQFKAQDLCDVVQVNLLLSHEQISQDLGVPKSDSNLNDNKRLTEEHDTVNPISPVENSARSQDVAESLHNTVELLELQHGNQEKEKERPSGAGADAADVKKSFEDVRKTSIQLAEGLRSLKDCELYQKPVEAYGEEETNGLGYACGAFSFISSRFSIRDKDGDEGITYPSTDEGHTKKIEDSWKLSRKANFTELKNVETCFYGEILDNTRSHSGARIAATAYFTANPHHKQDEIPSGPHRHIKCQDEGFTQVDIQSPHIFTSASIKEAEFRNLQVSFNCDNHICSISRFTSSLPERRRKSPGVGTHSMVEERKGTDDEKGVSIHDIHDIQVNTSNVKLVQGISPEDCERKLKLVGYLYEEVQPNVDVHAPDQLISSKMSSSPECKSAKSLPLEYENQAIETSIMPTGLADQTEHISAEAEETSEINDLTRPPCKINTAPIDITSGSQGDKDKPLKRQGGGVSSLIALTGVESLTRLGDEHRRDSGLAAKMATRIRHALESLGERSRANDKSINGSTTEVKCAKPRLDKGGLAGYRAPFGICSSNVGKKLRFKIDSEYPKAKSIGGDRNRLREGWIPTDASRPAAHSSDSVRQDEPETYLQQVIAALDSGNNESDVQEESDPQHDLSNSSEEDSQKRDVYLHEHHRAESRSPLKRTDEGRCVRSLKPCKIAHSHDCAHRRCPQLLERIPSTRPLHTGVRPCAQSEMQEELSEQSNWGSGCTGRWAKTDDKRSFREVRNSGKNDCSVEVSESAHPQAFSVRINGSVVEIEVGEEPPSIIWTPLGQNHQSVVLPTSSSYQTQENNNSEDAHKESYIAASSLSGRLISPQVISGQREFTDTTTAQTSDGHRVVRFRDPILPGKPSKSVRFHSASKDSGQDKFHSPKQMHDRFDRKVKSLARQAQGLTGIEGPGEVVGGSQQSHRLTQEKMQVNGAVIPSEVKSKVSLSFPSSESGPESLDDKIAHTLSIKNRHGVMVPVAGNTKGSKTNCTSGGEPSRPILKGSRGTPESDSEVQEHPMRGRQSKVTKTMRHSAPAAVDPPEIKVRTVKRRSILKIPRKRASSSSDHDGVNGVEDLHYDEDDISSPDERKEILEAAAAGLANELQILMRSRTPECNKDQEDRHDDCSSASELSGNSQRLRTPRPKKLPEFADFQPRKHDVFSQESPGGLKELGGHSRSIYHPTRSPHVSAPRNRLQGHFRLKHQADSSYLPSENRNESFGYSHSITKSRPQQNLGENGISVLAGGEGRDRFVYREAQRQSQKFKAASMRRAKQIVRDTLGDVFDYDQFQQELGVLARERKRVELLGRSLAVPKSDAVKLRHKEGILDQQRTSTSVPASVLKREVGSSGNKRHRSAISPLRESGKKMLRSDSGKKALSIARNADNQLHPHPANSRDSGFGNMTKPDFLILQGRKLPAHNNGNQMQKSRQLPKLQDDSISRRPSHKLITEFKTCVKEGGSRKSFEIPTFEKKQINFTIMEGGESNWPTGDQAAIKRKSLRPPGSFFKIATPVSWFPSNSTSNKCSKMDLLSGSSIFETSGTGKAGRSFSGRSSLKQKTLKPSVGKERNKGNKTVSEGLSIMERTTLNDTECPDRHTQKTPDFNSDFCKWVLTPSSVNLNTDKDSVLKPELVSAKSRATKPSIMASHGKPVDRTSERESWSERVKAFLLSCGALLPETNTSKHSKQSCFPTRLEVRVDDDNEWKAVPAKTTVHFMGKKRGLGSLRLLKMVNDKKEVKKPDIRRGRLEVAKNKLKLVSGVEISHSNKNSWESPRKFNTQRKLDSFEGSKKSPVKKTKRGFIGQRRGHDLLLKMLNNVSTGISKQKQLAKQESLRESREGRIKVPPGLAKDASTLVSLKVKDQSNTFPGIEGSKRGQKKLRVVEVKDPEDSFRIRRAEKKVHSTLKDKPDVNSERARDHDNTLQVCKNKVDGPVRRDSDEGKQFLKRGVRDSSEHWLNVSGGFEFLDRPDLDSQDFKRADLSETFRKDSDFQTSSHRTSLHSWSVRSVEVGVPEAYGSVPVEESFRKEKEKVPHGESMGMDKGRNVTSSLCEDNLQSQGLTDPVDFFIHPIQEYTEKSEVRGVMMHEVIQGGKQSLDDSPVAENIISFDFKSEKRASSCDMCTLSPSNVEDKLTETEELELACLELVMKTVLRNDIIKNTKRRCATTKEGTSSLVSNQREPQRFQVDEGWEVRAHNILHGGKPLSPTPKSSESAKSSVRDWPDYICLAEKQSRSESCEEDGDWPEYLALDEQAANIEREGEKDLPVAEDYSEKRPDTETFHDASTMTDLLHDASKMTSSSPLPTNVSESNDMEFIQFPGLSTLAFSCATSPRAMEAPYVADRNSTGVQTNDFSVGQALNSVYVLPLCCLPDGRPSLTPYSMYPTYPVPEWPSHIHPIQIPPAVQSVQSHATTAVIVDDVRGTSDIHRPRTEELQKLNSENESRIQLEGKSLSSSSSDAPLSSPTTPSTPNSSPEHEARVASALAHHRRRQKGQVLPCSPDVMDDASNRKGENEDRQADQKTFYQQLSVSIQEPLALTKCSYGETGHEEYPVALTTENQVSRELVHRSICDASASGRKELQISPFVYYDDTESCEWAASYDGSGSSEVSVSRKRHSGQDVPFVGLRVEGLENLNRDSTIPVLVTDTRVQSPGETKHPISPSSRQADGLQANVGRYSLEGHLMLGEKDITRWYAVTREPGALFSEGEIDPGVLKSDGECGRIYSKSEFQHQKHQYGGDVSEPGEVTRTGDHKYVTTVFDFMEKSSFIQSLSEGEIRPAELGQMKTAQEYAEQRSSSDLGGI